MAPEEAMLKLFRSADREHEEIAEASRRNDAAHDALRDAMRSVLQARNNGGRTDGAAKERCQ